MKKTSLFATLLLGLTLLMACSEEEGLTIDLIDPQQVEFVDDFFGEDNMDLVQAFGVDNIHFGHTPPNMEDISFYVEGMDYDTCIRYIFDIYNNNEPTLSHAIPPSYDASRNYHHFYNYIENISSHKLKTVDAYNDSYIRTNDSTFILGDAETNCFTAYYEEEIQEEGTGFPTNGILISGTLVYDNTGTFVGVNNYRIGKKIIRYKEHPTIPSFAQGTIEVKTHEGMAPYQLWDTRK